MRITLVRDDGKVKTLRTLKMELLLEQMKTEVKAQPVSKMREALRYALPGKSIEEVRKVPKVMPAAAFVRKEGVMTLNEYNGIVMMEVNDLSGRAEEEEEGEWLLAIDILRRIQKASKMTFSARQASYFGRILQRLGVKSKRKTYGTYYHVVPLEVD